MFIHFRIIFRLRNPNDELSSIRSLHLQISIKCLFSHQTFILFQPSYIYISRCLKHLTKKCTPTSLGLYFKTIVWTLFSYLRLWQILFSFTFILSCMKPIIDLDFIIGLPTPAVFPCSFRKMSFGFYKHFRFSNNFPPYFFSFHLQKKKII